MKSNAIKHKATFGSVDGLFRIIEQLKKEGRYQLAMEMESCIEVVKYPGAPNEWFRFFNTTYHLTKQPEPVIITPEIIDEEEEIPF